MFKLIKQAFIVFLSFSGSLTKKIGELYGELCLVRPTNINLNPYDLLYLLVMVSLSGCNGSGNTSDGRICVANETRFKCTNWIKNVKTFHVIAIANLMIENIIYI